MTRYVKIDVMKDGKWPEFTYEGFTPWLNCEGDLRRPDQVG
ncbi:MAG: hypothetical protein AMXMBFR7_26420 [Planctomycetota bacterium]